MSDSTKSRREFLINSATGLAGAALSASAFLSACRSLDRKIMGDGPDESRRVVILGAGLSGLVAARELKNAGIPFRVYEGTNRIGGRTFTIDDFNEASQSAELGAEWVSDSDEFVLNLCKELHLQTITVPESQKTPALFFEKKWNEASVAEKEILKINKTILRLKEKLKDEDLDKMSLEAFLQDHSKDFSALQRLWLKRVVQLQFGADEQELSMLAYADYFDQDLSAWTHFKQKRIRIFGGTQNIARALYDKIAGIIPGRTFVMGHKLQAIRSSGDLYQLEFQTDQGIHEIEARVIISTLPFSIVRNIRGINDLDFSEKKIRTIQELGFGSHGKLITSFKEKFWSERSSTWTGDISSGWLWDSSQTLMSSKLISRGLLSSTFASEAGKNAGLHSVETLKADLKKFKNFKEESIETSQVMNWSLNPMSKGSVSYFKPGQVTDFASEIANPERKGTFIFAGEQTSGTSMATMNGAIESGIRAAQEAARLKSELFA